MSLELENGCSAEEYQQIKATLGCTGDELPVEAAERLKQSITTLEYLRDRALQGEIRALQTAEAEKAELASLRSERSSWAHKLQAAEAAAGLAELARDQARAALEARLALEVAVEGNALPLVAALDAIADAIGHVCDAISDDHAQALVPVLRDLLSAIALLEEAQ